MRRNRHGMGRPRNPLATGFVLLLALAIILVIALISTNAKYSKVKKELSAAQKQITVYEKEEKERVEAEEKEEKERKEAEKKATEDAEKWLDMKGHSEIAVKPTAFFDKYYAYTTTDHLRLRAGPGTNYDNLVTIPPNTKIQAAAKNGDWTFVSYQNKFGWVKTEYLKLAGEAPKEAGTVSKQETTEKSEKTVEKTEKVPALTNDPDAEAVVPVIKTN